MKKLLILSVLFLFALSISAQIPVFGTKTYPVIKDTIYTCFNKVELSGKTNWYLEISWTSLNQTDAYITPKWGSTTRNPIGLWRGGLATDTIKLSSSSGSRIVWGTDLPTGMLGYDVAHGTCTAGSLTIKYFAKKQ